MNYNERLLLSRMELVESMLDRLYDSENMNESEALLAEQKKDYAFMSILESTAPYYLEEGKLKDMMGAMQSKIGAGVEKAKSFGKRAGAAIKKRPGRAAALTAALAAGGAGAAGMMGGGGGAPKAPAAAAAPAGKISLPGESKLRGFKTTKSGNVISAPYKDPQKSDDFAKTTGGQKIKTRSGYLKRSPNRAR
jgi:hypothetical protein